MPTVTVKPAISLDKFTSYLDFREANSAHQIYNMIDWERMEQVAK